MGKKQRKLAAQQQAEKLQGAAGHQPDAWQDLVDSLPDGKQFNTCAGGPFKRSFRIHPWRGKPSPSWGALTSVSWSPNGCYHAADLDPGKMLDYHTGCIYPQDAASQLPVTLLDPQPGEIIIDTCAAPGSKSTQIALAMEDRGLLICCDASASRRKALIENLARQGVINALVTPVRLDRLAEFAGRRADAVLVDAPCSGHEPRSHRQVARQAARQQHILADAAQLVAPGGRLVYSTCTPYAAENEEQVIKFLQQHPGWCLEQTVVLGAELSDIEYQDVSCGWRLWPQRHGCEPFYAVRLRAPQETPQLVGDLWGECPSQHFHDSHRSQHSNHIHHSATATIFDRLVNECKWLCYQRGHSLIAASSEAAQCRLPSEARGLLLGRDLDQLLPWAAQAVIAALPGVAEIVSHETACQLWSGDQQLSVPGDGMLISEYGAPLGQVLSGGLKLPARMTRRGLK